MLGNKVIIFHSILLPDSPIPGGRVYDLQLNSLEVIAYGRTDEAIVVVNENSAKDEYDINWLFFKEDPTVHHSTVKKELSLPEEPYTVHCDGNSNGVSITFDRHSHIEYVLFPAKKEVTEKANHSTKQWINDGHQAKLFSGILSVANYQSKDPKWRVMATVPESFDGYMHLDTYGFLLYDDVQIKSYSFGPMIKK